MVFAAVLEAAGGAVDLDVEALEREAVRLPPRIELSPGKDKVTLRFAT